MNNPITNLIFRPIRPWDNLEEAVQRKLKYGAHEQVISNKTMVKLVQRVIATSEQRRSNILNSLASNESPRAASLQRFLKGNRAVCAPLLSTASINTNSKREMAWDKYRTLEETKNESIMEVSRDIVFITREIFGRDKRLKAPNKVNVKNRSMDMQQYAANLLEGIRSNEKELAMTADRFKCGEYSVEPYIIGLSGLMVLSLGLCKEMKDVSYALLDKLGLNPECISYKLDDDFNHVACVITINEQELIVDPWANLVCKHENYLAELSDKIKKWVKESKYVIDDTGNAADIYQGNITPEKYVTPEDVLTMKIDYREIHAERSQLSTPFLYNTIEKILSGKE